MNKAEQYINHIVQQEEQALKRSKEELAQERQITKVY